RVSASQPARPGEVLVMAAAAGGYHPRRGLDPTAKGPVPDCPTLAVEPAPAAGVEDAYRQDDTSVDQRRWLLLERHSEEVRDHVRALLAAIESDLPAPVAEAAVRAGYLHDLGKCHPTWQEALCQLAPPEERQMRLAAGPWAKSAVNGQLRYPGGGSFRHELVSLLLLDGPLAGLLADVADPDLVRYLVLAHHGKLRLQVRGVDDRQEKTLLGLTQDTGVAVPPLLGQPAGQLTVDLAPFRLGSGRSWTRTALALRDEHGPFVLAYLETLVRVADWRASAGMEEATR